MIYSLEMNILDLNIGKMIESHWNSLKIGVPIILFTLCDGFGLGPWIIQGFVLGPWSTYACEGVSVLVGVFLTL